MFWTGLECWNEAPQESLCTGRSGHILERETVGVSVFVVSADAGRNSKKKKVCCKDGKHFDQPVCSRCCETFPPRVPRFPSRLIKEEIALEEAMMTQGLVVVQRPLYRVHILHKKHSSKCLHQNSLSQQWMSPSGHC